MRTIQEIAALLPTLTTAELHHIERVIRDLYRVRHEPIIYDDDYGIWTEHDQVSVASEVLEMLIKRRNWKAMPKRGEVWLADLGLAAKTRPVLVLSTPFSTFEKIKEICRS